MRSDVGDKNGRFMVAEHHKDSIMKIELFIGNAFGNNVIMFPYQNGYIYYDDNSNNIFSYNGKKNNKISFRATTKISYISSIALVAEDVLEIRGHRITIFNQASYEQGKEVGNIYHYDLKTKKWKEQTSGCFIYNSFYLE